MGYFGVLSCVIETFWVILGTFEPVWGYFGVLVSKLGAGLWDLGTVGFCGVLRDFGGFVALRFVWCLTVFGRSGLWVWSVRDYTVSTLDFGC